MHIQVIQFPPAPGRLSAARLIKEMEFLDREEFHTGNGLRMQLIHAYTLQGAVTVTEYGSDTFFSLWVGGEVTKGFKQALEAQSVMGPESTEELFGRLMQELAWDDYGKPDPRPVSVAHAVELGLLAPGEEG